MRTKVPHWRWLNAVFRGPLGNLIQHSPQAPLFFRSSRPYPPGQALLGASPGTRTSLGPLGVNRPSWHEGTILIQTARKTAGRGQRWLISHSGLASPRHGGTRTM